MIHRRRSPEEPPIATDPTETATGSAASTATATATRASEQPSAHPTAASWGRGPGAEPLEDAPTRIGPWRVVRELGRGGMGRVWLAEDEAGRRVAIKRAVSRRYAAALRREAEALAGFVHPGVARRVDAGLDDARPWYAMRFVDGPTLDRAAGARPLPARVGLLVRLCETLAALHRAGGVHRDVKPANVLVEGDRPVLIDFGLMLPVGGERADMPGWARDRIFGAPDGAGTRGYRAPEQAAGGWVDGRADLYPIGRMLADWLGPGDPPALHALAARLQAPRPADRPGDAAAVALRLADFADLDAAALAARLAALPPTLHRAALVGREPLLAQVLDGVRAVESGAGRALVFEGPSGIGKTRLALEAVRLAQGFRRVTAECRADGALLHGFAPLLSLAIDRCRDHPARTAEVFGAAGPTLQTFAPAIAALPGQSARPATRAGPDALAAALGGVLDGLTRTRPLLMLVDDAHAADRITTALLSRLVGHPRVLWVLTLRPARSTTALDGLLAAPQTTVHRLAPLDPAAVAGLVADLLGWPDPPTERVAEVARRAQGNPFFVAECLRADMAEGRLRAAERRWDPPPSDLPEPVEASIRRRLVGLGPDAQALLDAAAILGPEASTARIDRLCDRPPTPDAVERVIQRAVCVRRGDRLRFAHDRLRAVTYAALDPARRRALHRAAADDLQARPPADAYVAARALAHHRAGADQLEAAARARRDAGAIAEARGALEDAIADYAAAALDGPDGVAARLDGARCLELLGRRRDAAAVQQAAVDAARARGHRALEARALSALGRSLEFVERADEARAALMRSLALYEALDDPQGLALACTRLALFRQHRGEFEAAEALHRRALALNSTAGHRFGVAASANNLAVLAGDRGHYDAAVEHLEQARAAIGETDRRGTALLIENHRAYALHRAGRVPEALAAYDASLEALAAAQLHPQRAMTLLRRAGLRRQLGEAVEPGLAALHEAERLFADADAPLARAALACERGHHRLALGEDAADALSDARRHFGHLDIDRETPSLAGWMLGWLADAQAAFAAGEAGLWGGQLWHTVYPGVRAWLTARGRGPHRQRSAQ